MRSSAIALTVLVALLAVAVQGTLFRVVGRS